MNTLSKIIVYPILGALVLGLFVACYLAGCLWSGYVLSVLWGWFVVPTFSLPTLGVWTASGLMCIVRFTTFQVNVKELMEDSSKEDSTKKTMALASMAILLPLMFLIFGWLIKLMM